jgi:polar amino acid transport system substrate-binding protein
MSRSKRGFGATASALLACWFAACTAAPAAAPTSAPATSAPAAGAATPATATQVDASKLPLVQAGHLTLVTQDVQPPFSVVNTAGQREGFAIDLFDEMARRWGLQVTYTGMPLAALVPALSNGQYDAGAANLSVDGKPGLDFSQPTIWSYSSLIVLKSTPYPRLEDMNGKVVAAIQGSVQETLVKSYTNVNASSFANEPNMLAALRGGQIDGFVVGGTTAEPLLNQNGDVMEAQQIPSTSRTGFPVRKGNEAMLNAINTELNAMINEGLFIKLYRKWFTSPPSPKILELYPILATQ